MSTKAAAPLPPKPASRSRTKRVIDADALASDLDRVLKVSQPKVAPKAPTRRTAASSSKQKPATDEPAKIAPARVATKHTSRVASKPLQEKPQPRTTSASKRKAPSDVEELPWMKAGAMSSRERAQAAQVASNDALRLLGEASQVGFKYSSSKGEWTRTRADQVLRSGGRGLAVLRGLYGGPDSTPVRRATVERGAIALITRCIGLEMYTPALGVLVEIRPHVLSLYDHLEEPAPGAPRPPLTPLTAEWVPLFDLPPSRGDVDEGIRSVLCSYTIAAWSCLLSLGLAPESLASFLLPPPNPSVHPFTLAPALSLATIGQLAVYLYRAARDDSDEQGSPAWLKIRLISAFASAISASGSGDAKNSPERVWSSVRRTVTVHLEKGGDNARREVAEYIGQIVDVVEAISQKRKEPREAWFCGHWNAVLDVWTDIGRLLGDSNVIDRVLSAATAGATIASPSACGSSTPVTTASSTPSSSKREVRKPTTAVKNAAGEVTRTCAQLAKILVDVSSPEVDPEAYQHSLSCVDFETITNILCSLKTSEGFSLLRSIERLRRTVVKSVDIGALENASISWLQSCIEFVARLLPALESTDDTVRECMPGVIDSTLALMKRNSTAECSAFSLDQLDTVFATFDANSAPIDSASRAHYANCLIQCAYSLALKFSKGDGLPTAIGLCRRSCDWSQTFLAKNGDAGEAVRKAISGPLGKRYELLGFCLQKTSDKTGALQAYIQSCLCLDSATVNQISADAATKPLRVVFAPLAEFTTSLKRTASLLSHDEGLGAEFVPLLAHELHAAQLSPSVTGALVEQIIEAVEPSQFMPHVQNALVALHHMCLDLYAAETYPVRRLRAISRFLSFITSTGASGEQYESLKAEADGLAATKELAKDVALARYTQEYYGSIFILCALQVYHQTESLEGVSEFGRAALDKSRSFISPTPPASTTAAAKRAPAARGKATASSRMAKAPVRATARKLTPTAAAAKGKAAPAAKVDAPAPIEMDDAERFSGLLNALASLFGLLGYLVLKIEALNLLRTLQRSLPSMIDAYIQTSSQVAAEYGRLGKYSRAQQIFAKAIKHAHDAGDVSPAARTELHLRHCRFLVLAGQINQAKQDFMAAKNLSADIPAPGATGTYASRWIQICAMSERTALAHAAVAAIRMAECEVTAAVANLVIAYRLWSRAASGIAHIASAGPVDEPMEPKEDITASTKDKKKATAFDGKRLGGLQWYFAEALFEATFDVSLALAQQGSVKECEYYLLQARNMVASVRSSTLDARTAARTAEFETRRLHFDKTLEQINHAASVLAVDGTDLVDLQRIKGDLLSRQQETPAADEMFAGAVENLVGLDRDFTTAEMRMPSPRKDSVPPNGSREPLMPLSLGHLLRQRAWLLREGDNLDEYEEIFEQLKLVRASGDQPEQLLLEARVAMHDAFRYFKTDLFMSSLTESTIALTMGSPGKRTKSKAQERQSSRHDAVVQLELASSAFRKTLARIARTGRVEDVRQTCVSLALLGAFQTSLGHGSPLTTVSAACTLASVSTITLHRELLGAIDSKYADPEADDMDWPSLDSALAASEPVDALQAYWADVRAKHCDLDLIRSDYDLSSLPANWAVVSITVTDDRNTMLVTRHQNGHEPIVFCIPLDRQGRREGEDEDELFSFDAGVAEMRAIIAGNDASIKSIKDRVSMDDRKAWWKERHDLDTRLSELLATIEFCWLGAFKTVLNPRLEFDEVPLEAFRRRLDTIFGAALKNGGSRGSRVRLNDTLLACFATLSSKCRDEEVEDLVYFVLDLYQFHGIAVALAELDFDQIGVDVKAALADLELATGHCARGETDEHLLLALDKNVQAFPWESIPILRGRAVSRITSLPFLLDQVELGARLGADSGHWTIDARKAKYLLNPGGDLVNTQKRFEDRLSALHSEGWEGITARRPSETEMASALSDSELVMYFGHGGGEEFIRGHKVRALKRCAVTMLWGCSSGLLREQGDLDCTGTPYDYALAGAPCLVANLWDVTDKDIDRITASVMDSLALEAGKLGDEAVRGTSVVQAVSKGRTAARLQYLTGAALVVYGVPVYMA